MKTNSLLIKKTSILLFLLISVLLFTTCKREILKPKNIFEPEVLDIDAEGITLNGFPGAETIYVNDESLEETENGYKIKGTVFIKTAATKEKSAPGDAEGALAFAGGDFNIDMDKGTGNVKLFAGRGAPLLPDEGIFGAIKGKIPNAEFMYQEGKVIKAEHPADGLPLQDDICYMGFSLNNTYGAKIQLGQVGIMPKHFYMDPTDPMFYAKAEVSMKGNPITNARVGLSAHGNILWTPREYDETMHRMAGREDIFDEFSGHFVLGGGISLDDILKIPVEIDGDLTLDCGDNPLEFFENGFEGLDLELGVNAKAILTNDLIDFFPGNLQIELGHATLQAKLEDGIPQFIRIAGIQKLDITNTMDVINELLPEPVAKVLGVGQQAVASYLNSLPSRRYFVELDENGWKVVFNMQTQFSYPGIPLNGVADATIGVTSDSIFCTFTAALPYGLGNVDVHGVFTYDGKFHLKGVANTSLNISDGLSFGAHLQIEISNKEFIGLKFNGDVNLPFGIGDVLVDGGLTTEELYFHGIINSNIDFGGGIEFPALDMEVDVSTKTGVKLKGVLDIPYGIAHVEVEGEISKRGIGISGTFSSDINFGGGVRLPAIDMALSVSSWDGAHIKGILDVPYGIAHVEIKGSFSSTGLEVYGAFETDVNFGNGFRLPAINMSLSASTDPHEGVSFAGKMTMPGNLGMIEVAGNLSVDDISFSGKLKSKLDLGFTSFQTDLMVLVSTKGGEIHGSMEFPFGFGEINVDGELYADGKFSMTGSYEYGVDFDIIDLSVGFEARVSTEEVGFKAWGKGCIDFGLFETCYKMGVDITVNWAEPSLEACIDFALGDACISINKNGKNLQTNQPAFRRIGPLTKNQLQTKYIDHENDPPVKKMKN